MTTVRYAVRDTVAVIEFSNPPGNRFSYTLRREVMGAVERAGVDTKVRAIVLYGGGGLFSSSTDVQDLAETQPVRGPSLPELVRALESSNKPVVAAIEGDCLGGGFQLTLGCHYRVADQHARLGLPEVRLGLLPCAGGTQRLPRLCGIAFALRMIVTGESLTAMDLSSTPLLDRVVAGNTLAAAIEFAASVAQDGAELPRTRDRLVNDRNAKLIFDHARFRARSAPGALTARLRAVDAVEAAITQSFDEGIRTERALYKELQSTAESRALRHAFSARRDAGRISDVSDSTPARQIDQVAVVGAGPMGIAITLLFMDAGIPVRLLEPAEVELDRACGRIREAQESRLRQGKLTPQQRDARLELLTPTLSYASLTNVDFVIETVFDDLTIKQHVFSTLDRSVRRGAILATSSTAIGLNRIAHATRRPKDTVGVCFFGNEHSLRLVEVIRGDETADDVLVTTVKLIRRLKKAPVVIRASDGFAANRMLASFFQQAVSLVEEGASPYEVDAAMEKFGFSRGPFRMSDLGGMPSDASTLVDWLSELDRGWYDLSTSGDAVPSPVVEELIRNYRAEKEITPRPIDEREIVDRLVCALIVEGARILEDRTVERASDIDVIALVGYGFPTWRGGPMLYADMVGVDHVALRIKEFAANPRARPEFWKPPFLLRRLAMERKAFNGTLERR